MCLTNNQTRAGYDWHMPIKLHDKAPIISNSPRMIWAKIPNYVGRIPKSGGESISVRPDFGESMLFARRANFRSVANLGRTGEGEFSIGWRKTSLTNSMANFQKCGENSSSLRLYVSVSLSLSFHPPLPLPLSLSLSLCLSLTNSLSFCLFVIHTLSLFLSPSRALSLAQ